MDQITLWCVVGVIGAISLNTIWRIYSERDRFLKEDLSDTDSAFAWQIIIFLILPLLTLFDFRTTSVCAQLLGGYLSDIRYAILWYQAIPVELSSNNMFTQVLFSGTIVETLLVLL